MTQQQQLFQTLQSTFGHTTLRPGNRKSLNLYFKAKVQSLFLQLVQASRCVISYQQY